MVNTNFFLAHVAMVGIGVFMNSYIHAITHVTFKAKSVKREGLHRVAHYLVFPVFTFACSLTLKSTLSTLFHFGKSTISFTGICKPRVIKSAISIIPWPYIVIYM